MPLESITNSANRPFIFPESSPTSNYEQLDPRPWPTFVKSLCRPGKPTRTNKIIFLTLFAIQHICMFTIFFLLITLYLNHDTFSIRLHCPPTPSPSPTPSPTSRTTISIWTCQETARFETTFFITLVILVITIICVGTWFLLRDMFLGTWSQGGWEDSRVGRCCKRFWGFPREVRCNEQNEGHHGVGEGEREGLITRSRSERRLVVPKTQPKLMGRRSMPI